MSRASAVVAETPSTQASVANKKRLSNEVLWLPWLLSSKIFNCNYRSS